MKRLPKTNSIPAREIAKRSIPSLLLLFLTFFLGSVGAAAAVTPTAPLPPPVAVDTAREGSSWEERVRRGEQRQLERTRETREVLVEWRWEPGGKRYGAPWEPVAARKRWDGGSLSARVNAVRWLTGTVDGGVEWRLDERWGVIAGGAWTSWSWRDGKRRYALWSVTAEGRRYLGAAGRWHAGVFAHAGEFNRKLGTTGRQGNYAGGGMAAGYALPLGGAWMLDVTLGAGYTRAEYDRYRLENGTRVRAGEVVKNYWGVNRVAVTLAWKIF